jgi:hypothetical protein
MIYTNSILGATTQHTESFRQFISGTESIFAHMGWVNMNVSGTVNFEVVNPPTAVSQVRGYSVWRMDDIYQADYPIYARIEYRSNVSFVNRFTLALQIGTAVDGINIGGVRTTNRTLDSSAGTIVVGYNMIYASGDAGRIAVAINPEWQVQAAPAHTNGEKFFYIERGRLPNGDINPQRAVVGALTPNDGGTNLNGRIEEIVMFNRPSEPGLIVPGATQTHGSQGIPLYFPREPGLNTMNDSDFHFNELHASLPFYGIPTVGPYTSFMGVRARTGISHPGRLQHFTIFGQSVPYLRLSSMYYVNPIIPSNQIADVYMRWE